MLCTVQIQATSSCSHIDKIQDSYCESCLSCPVWLWWGFAGTQWSLRGMTARLTGLQSKRVGGQSRLVSLSAASSWWRLDSSAGGQLYVGLLPSSSCGTGAHPLLDFSSHSHERLLHICGVLGTGFQKRDAQRVCKLLDTMDDRSLGIFFAVVRFLAFLYLYWCKAK